MKYDPSKKNGRGTASPRPQMSLMRRNSFAFLGGIVGASALSACVGGGSTASAGADSSGAVARASPKVKASGGTSAYTFDVTAYGAVGNGTTDCTSAFQAAINAALLQSYATIVIPAGEYLITGQLTWQKGAAGSEQSYNISVEGNDYGSIIIHQNASPLFAFNNLVDYLTVRNLVILSPNVKSGVTQSVFYFPYGNTHSYFISIQAMGSGGGAPACLYYCAPGVTNDTVVFEDIFCTPIQTVGIQIGSGSSIFISNGRIIGSLAASPTGILFTGGMGGVYISCMDIINLGSGISINQNSGTTNREFFLSQVTCDSCNIGFGVYDSSSYVNWQGVWAASSNININYNPSSNAAILNLSGGTIFNAGNNSSTRGTYNYGLSYNGLGYVQMTGVVVRNNTGGGFIMNQASGASVMITGCQFIANGGLGGIKALSGLTQTGNVLG